MSRRLSLLPTDPDVIRHRRGDFTITREYAPDMAACVKAIRVVLDSKPQVSTPDPEEALAQYPELAAAG